MQRDFWDRKIDLDKLKGYVYGLVDPQDKSIFYIGRGGGTQAQGNTRPNSHLIEAYAYLNEPTNKKEKKKLEKIVEIWNKHRLVELVILRRGLDLDTAVQVEATLIQAFNFAGKVKLTNEYDGFHNRECGLVNSENAVNLYATKLAKYDTPPKGVNLWIFPVKNNLKKGLDPYISTISAWDVSDSHKGLLDECVNYAIGVDANKISRSVIKIEQWVPDDMYSNSKKYKILGEDISTGDGQPFFEKSFEELLNKDYAQVPRKENAKNHGLGYWLNGNYLIVNINGRKVKYLRGNRMYDEINLSDD